MKRTTYIRSIVCLAFLCLSTAHAASQTTSAVNQPQAAEAYGRLPMSFEANQGQSDSQVKFLSRGSGYSLFLTRNEAVLALKKQGKKASRSPHFEPASLATRRPEPQSEAVLHMRLVGANATAPVTGLDELPGKSNYFIGNDPSKWRTGVPNYAKVKYANVYPGVDLIYYGNQRQLEFDLVVQPGADPKTVRLHFRGTVKGKQAALRIDEKGDLVVGTRGQEVIFHKPVVYQPSTNDETRATHEGVGGLIDGKFVLTGAHLVRFQIAAYDKSKPLVIDPTLVYSTYLGGSGGDVGNGIAVDASGNAYITGPTQSSNFPVTSGAFQTGYRGCPFCGDAFISKLNAAGSALLYSTYLGGSSDDAGNAIAVNAAGNAYVTGNTSSADFPTTAGAFQTVFGGGGEDAFVVKLNPSGSALVYSTYLGGRLFGVGPGDEGFGIAIDGLGNAYVTGQTSSPDFPITSNAIQAIFGGFDDAFVTKLNAAGSALVYSTYLGGSGEDIAGSIAVDASGNAYVTGVTVSSNFPTTPGAFQPTGIHGAFVSKLNPAGSAFIYSTYLRGNNFDAGKGIATDASGNAYVTGITQSSDFPTTPGAFQTTLTGDQAAFVSKLNATGSALFYSTYLGGSGSAGGDDFAFGIATDASGNAYVTGRTNSSNFPTTPGAFQPNLAGDSDAFVSKLNATGTALLYSTFLGGSGHDDARGIAVDRSGKAYVTGFTDSSDFPITPGVFQTTLKGPIDIFVSRFDLASTAKGADLALGKIGASNTTIPGGKINYAITLNDNLGPDAASAVKVTDILPAGTTFVSCSADAGGICANTGNVVTISFPTIANAHSAYITLVAQVGATVPSGTIIRNTATVTSATPDPNPNNNSSSVNTVVRYTSDLSIQKTIVMSPTPGELKYLITVKAPTTAHGVTVNDPLPSGTTFVSATPSQGKCSTPAVGATGTVNCQLFGIAGNTSASVFIIVKVTAPSGTTISNTATVNAWTFDPNPANNSSTITTKVP